MRVDCYAIKVDGVLLVNSTDNRYTRITVPYDVPSTLYYNCGVHSNMGNSITSFVTDETKADQYASHLVFAAPFSSDFEEVTPEIQGVSKSKTLTISGEGWFQMSKIIFIIHRDIWMELVII